jgi:hypothetical protein
MTVGAEEPEQILSQDTRGRVLVTPERRELLLAEYDRSGMSGMKFTQYVGIKYSTLAYWLQRRREQRRKEKSLVKAGADPKPGRSNGGWIEAVVENASGSGVPAGTLRIYFAGGAYCQISSAAEMALAAELLGRLGARR